MTSVIEKLLYSRDEASAAMGISSRTLDRLIENRDIDYVKVRGRVMVTSRQMHQYIEDRTVEA